MQAAQHCLLATACILIIMYTISGVNGCATGEVSCGIGGPCVPFEQQCDGIPNCLHGQQDESIELCKSRPCTSESLSGDLFRCDYGACIDQLFVCNGIANCADGSDETPQLCNDAVCRERRPFKCDYGACINKRKKCDGHRSCYHDGSDETFQACGSNICRSDKFRCNYGACIFQRKKCDGRRDCADDSDESEETCGLGHAVTVKATTTNPTSIITVESSTGMSSTPVTPAIPSPHNNGSTMFPSNCCQCPQPSQHLCLPCSPNLNLTCAAIENHVECHLPNNFEENVELDVLDCGALDYIIMESFERNDMACNSSSSVPVLTRVVANCWKTKVFIAQCQHDGMWHSYSNEETPLFSPAKSLCQQGNVNAPACGIHPRFDPDPLDFEGGYILGSYLDQAPWPWLVGILRKNQYYCTGTLISPHFVLTAAHCVAQSQESPRPVDIRNVLIQRYNYSGFEYPDYPEQWISRIIIHPEFVPGSRPLHDIALVKLEKPVVFNKYTYPACVRTKNLEETLIGWTFNRTEGQLDYSWKDFEQQMDPSCRSSEDLNRAEGCDRGLNVHQYQFCAINMDIDKWLYPGSSGGPFLVNSGDDSNELWEISGIVSSSVNDNSCDVPYTIFTDVPAYADWVANCVNYDKCNL